MRNFQVIPELVVSICKKISLGLSVGALTIDTSTTTDVWWRTNQSYRLTLRHPTQADMHQKPPNHHKIAPVLL